ncbi:MAG: glycolate oxidase subunit GlcE [Rhodospirillaceae bacterium]
MSVILKPASHADVLDAVKWAAAEAHPLDVRGGGSKLAFGRPMQTAGLLDLSAMAGITDYDPGELVMTCGPATPMADIEKALSDAGQELAFEPMDLGPLLLGAAVEDGGQEAGMTGTIGGVIGANLSGPRRIKMGAARDHFLGFKAVSGRGEEFKSGGRVMKNVTGFDLSKLMAGSFGTLAVMTEVTIKVLPRSEKTRTVLLMTQDDGPAQRALSDALGASLEVAGAAHLPADVAARSGVGYVSGAGTSVTAARIEGPGPSVEHRCKQLREMWGKQGKVEELHSMNSAKFWAEVRDALYFTGERAGAQVWRVSTAPTAGPGVAEILRRETGGEIYFDWGGGLIWLALDNQMNAAADVVQQAAAHTGGHATLIRASRDVRANVDVFQPQPAPLAELSRRVKNAFDPNGVLNPGRMAAGV